MSPTSALTTPALRVGVVLALLVVHPSLARADGGAVAVPCNEPFVLPAIAVNVVVLPYSLPLELKQRSRAADRLGLLIQREAARLAAKYGLHSVFSVELVESRNHECKVETVRDQLLGRIPGAQEVILPGYGLVLVWGRIYESDDGLFVQTFVQFLRRGTAEGVELSVGGQTLFGELSGQGFAGLQRRITADDLEQVRAASKEALTVYDSPTEDAQRESKRLGGRRFYYFVAEKGSDWTRIESFVPLPPTRSSPDSPYKRPRRVGWIRSRVDREDWKLRALIPELAFVDAISGYLSLRVTASRQLKSETNWWLWRQHKHTATVALLKYQATVSNNQVRAEGVLPAAGYDFASAIPIQVAGMLELLTPELQSKNINAADLCFRQASRLLSADADARNLRVLSGILLAYHGAPSALTPDDAESMLLDAVALDPTNSIALRNLASIYELRLQHTQEHPANWEALPVERREEMQARLEAVRGMIQSGHQ